MDPQAMAFVSIGLNAALGVVAFLFKGALSDRDRRLDDLDRELAGVTARVTSTELTQASQNTKIDAIYDLLERIDKSIERIQSRLEKE